VTICRACGGGQFLQGLQSALIWTFLSLRFSRTKKTLLLVGFFYGLTNNCLPAIIVA
jgi:hypothetical protein